MKDDGATMRLDATAEASADAGVVARDDNHRGAGEKRNRQESNIDVV